VYYTVDRLNEIVEGERAHTSEVGLEVQAEDHGELISVSVDVEITEESLLEDIRLVVVLIEDEVIGEGPLYDQRNYGNDDPDHPYYQQGNYIEGFVHTNIIRDVLTDYQGDLLDLSSGSSQWSGDVEVTNPEGHSILVFVTDDLPDFPPVLNAHKEPVD